MVKGKQEQDEVSGMVENILSEACGTLSLLWDEWELFINEEILLVYKEAGLQVDKQKKPEKEFQL